MIAARHTSIALLLLAAGCAPPRTRVPGPAGTRPPTSAPAVDVAARLLRLEDRREYDARALEAAGSSANASERRMAALAAGRIRDRRSVPLLGRLAADPDTSVAATAAFALGLIADSTAVPLLDRKSVV